MVNNEISEDMLAETGDGRGDCTDTSTPSSEPQTGASKNESSPTSKEADEPASSADENVRLSPTSLFCSVPLNRDVQTIIDTFPKTEAEKAGKKTRKIPCLYCDRTFVADNLRQKHVERSHSIKQARRSSSRFQQSAASVSCLFCNKFTLTENKLSDLFHHLATAHPTKYFGCLPCEERFATLSQLDEHNEYSHGIKREVKVQSTEEISDTKTNSAITDNSVVKTRHKAKIKEEGDQSDETKPMLRRGRQQVLQKELKHKKISIKSTKLGIKRSARLQSKVVPTKGKKRTKPKERAPEEPKLEKEKEIKVSSTENPYPTFDAFFRVKRITDHSIDNLRITSLTFNDVFDQAFYTRIKCNIRENLLNHLDGKLFENEESESRISNFEKTQTGISNTENYGCEISLNAATPVAASLLTAQFGDDPESQIEYGSKASKKKSTPKQDEVHYKYFTRRKYQASILESKENRDLSKLDMWTQLVIKRRQQKILKDTKSDREKLDYKKCEEYRAKKQNQELNRILDRRGPFEDLKEEANKKAALEGNFNQEAYSDVSFILDDILGNVFSKVIEDVEVKTELTDLEIPSFLNLRKASLSNDSYVDKSDKITLICSSQETENFEAPDISPKDKNALVELTGEWARSRLYICAACGLKVANLKLLIDHKNIIHQNVWCQHYEFVGNQGKFYRHLSIPGLGKMEKLETNCTYKIWKRSEARTCTKCKKQCNSLAELHRHVLECGEDWSWMLVRKKCKYKPFGAKTRKKRRGLFKRIIHKEKPVDENREKKTYKKEGPRVKPSDADTIQRMLANLPAKRATRKIMSLKDGFPKIGKKTTYKKKTPETPTTNPVTIKTKKQNMQMRRNRAELLLHDTNNILKGKMLKIKGMKCNPVNNLRKSMRNLNKVISSSIIDTNSTLMVKRKIKNAIQQQRLTRRSRQTQEDEDEDEEPEVKKPPTTPKKVQSPKKTITKKKLINEETVDRKAKAIIKKKAVSETAVNPDSNLKKSVKKKLMNEESGDLELQAKKTAVKKKLIGEESNNLEADLKKSNAKNNVVIEKLPVLEENTVEQKELISEGSANDEIKIREESANLEANSKKTTIQSKVISNAAVSPNDDCKNAVREDSDKEEKKVVRKTRSTSSLPESKELIEKVESPVKKKACKNKFGSKLMRTLSLRKKTKIAKLKPTDRKSENETASVDTEDTKNNGKRKSRLDTFKNVVKKMRLVKENLRSQKRAAEVVGDHFLDSGASETVAETVIPVCELNNSDNNGNSENNVVLETEVSEPEPLVSKSANCEQKQAEDVLVKVICDKSSEIEAAASACEPVAHTVSEITDITNVKVKQEVISEKVLVPKGKLCKRAKGLNACIAMLTSKLQQKEVETDHPINLSIPGKSNTREDPELPILTKEVDNIAIPLIEMKIVNEAAITVKKEVIDELESEQVIRESEISKSTEENVALHPESTNISQTKPTEDARIISPETQAVDKLEVPEIPLESLKNKPIETPIIEEKENIIEQKMNSPRNEEIRLEKVVDIIKCFEDMNSKENINGHNKNGLPKAQKKTAKKIGSYKKKPGKSKLNIIDIQSSENVIPSIEDKLNTAILEEENEIQRDSLTSRKLGQRRTVPKRNTKTNKIQVDTVELKIPNVGIPIENEDKTKSDEIIAAKPVKKLIKEPKLIFDSQFKNQTLIKPPILSFPDIKSCDANMKTLIKPPIIKDVFSFTELKPSDTKDCKPQSFIKPAVIKDIFSFAELKPIEAIRPQSLIKPPVINFNDSSSYVKPQTIIKPAKIKDVFSFSSDNNLIPQTVIKPTIMKELFSSLIKPSIIKDVLTSSDPIIKPSVMKDTFSFTESKPSDSMVSKLFNPLHKINGLLDFQPNIFDLNKPRSKSFGVLDKVEKSINTSLPNLKNTLDEPDILENKSFVEKSLIIDEKDSTDSEDEVPLAALVKTVKTKECESIEKKADDSKGRISNEAQIDKKEKYNCSHVQNSFTDPVLQAEQGSYRKVEEMENLGTDLTTGRLQQTEKRKCKKKGKLKKSVPDDCEEIYMEHKPLLDSSNSTTKMSLLDSIVNAKQKSLLDSNSPIKKTLLDLTSKRKTKKNKSNGKLTTGTEDKVELEENIATPDEFTKPETGFVTKITIQKGCVFQDPTEVLISAYGKEENQEDKPSGIIERYDTIMSSPKPKRGRKAKTIIEKFESNGVSPKHRKCKKTEPIIDDIDESLLYSKKEAQEILGKSRKPRSKKVDTTKESIQVTIAPVTEEFLKPQINESEELLKSQLHQSVESPKHQKEKIEDLSKPLQNKFVEILQATLIEPKKMSSKSNKLKNKLSSEDVSEMKSIKQKDDVQENITSIDSGSGKSFPEACANVGTVVLNSDIREITSSSIDSNLTSTESSTKLTDEVTSTFNLTSAASPMKSKYDVTPSSNFSIGTTPVSEKCDISRFDFINEEPLTENSAHLVSKTSIVEVQPDSVPTNLDIQKSISIATASLQIPESFTKAIAILDAQEWKQRRGLELGLVSSIIPESVSKTKIKKTRKATDYNDDSDGQLFDTGNPKLTLLKELDDDHQSLKEKTKTTKKSKGTHLLQDLEGPQNLELDITPSKENNTKTTKTTNEKSHMSIESFLQDLKGSMPAPKLGLEILPMKTVKGNNTKMVAKTPKQEKIIAESILEDLRDTLLSSNLELDLTPFDKVMQKVYFEEISRVSTPEIVQTSIKPPAKNKRGRKPNSLKKSALFLNLEKSEELLDKHVILPSKIKTSTLFLNPEQLDTQELIKPPAVKGCELFLNPERSDELVAKELIYNPELSVQNMDDPIPPENPSIQEIKPKGRKQRNNKTHLKSDDKNVEFEDVTDLTKQSKSKTLSNMLLKFEAECYKKELIKTPGDIKSTSLKSPNFEEIEPNIIPPPRLVPTEKLPKATTTLSASLRVEEELKARNPPTVNLDVEELQLINSNMLESEQSQQIASLSLPVEEMQPKAKKQRVKKSEPTTEKLFEFEDFFRDPVIQKMDEDIRAIKQQITTLNSFEIKETLPKTDKQRTIKSQPIIHNIFKDLVTQKNTEDINLAAPRKARKSSKIFESENHVKEPLVINVAEDINLARQQKNKRLSNIIKIPTLGAKFDIEADEDCREEPELSTESFEFEEISPKSRKETKSIKDQIFDFQEDIEDPIIKQGADDIILMHQENMKFEKKNSKDSFKKATENIILMEQQKNKILSNDVPKGTNSDFEAELSNDDLSKMFSAEESQLKSKKSKKKKSQLVSNVALETNVDFDANDNSELAESSFEITPKVRKPRTKNLELISDDKIFEFEHIGGKPAIDVNEDINITKKIKRLSDVIKVPVCGTNVDFRGEGYENDNSKLLIKSNDQTISPSKQPNECIFSQNLEIEEPKLRKQKFKSQNISAAKEQNPNKSDIDKIFEFEDSADEQESGDLNLKKRQWCLKLSNIIKVPVVSSNFDFEELTKSATEDVNVTKLQKNKKLESNVIPTLKDKFEFGDVEELQDNVTKDISTIKSKKSKRSSNVAKEPEPITNFEFEEEIDEPLQNFVSKMAKKQFVNIEIEENTAIQANAESSEIIAVSPIKVRKTKSKKYNLIENLPILTQQFLVTTKSPPEIQEDEDESTMNETKMLLTPSKIRKAKSKKQDHLLHTTQTLFGQEDVASTKIRKAKSRKNYILQDVPPVIEEVSQTAQKVNRDNDEEVDFLTTTKTRKAKGRKNYIIDSPTLIEDGSENEIISDKSTKIKSRRTKIRKNYTVEDSLLYIVDPSEMFNEISKGVISEAISSKSKRVKTKQNYMTGDSQLLIDHSLGSQDISNETEEGISQDMASPPKTSNVKTRKKYISKDSQPLINDVEVVTEDEGVIPEDVTTLTKLKNAKTRKNFAIDDSPPRLIDFPSLVTGKVTNVIDETSINVVSEDLATSTRTRRAKIGINYAIEDSPPYVDDSSCITIENETSMDISEGLTTKPRRGKDRKKITIEDSQLLIEDPSCKIQEVIRFNEEASTGEEIISENSFTSTRSSRAKSRENDSIGDLPLFIAEHSDVSQEVAKENEEIIPEDVITKSRRAKTRKNYTIYDSPLLIDDISQDVINGSEEIVSEDWKTLTQSRRVERSKNYVFEDSPLLIDERSNVSQEVTNDNEKDLATSTKSRRAKIWKNYSIDESPLLIDDHSDISQESNEIEEIVSKDLEISTKTRRAKTRPNYTIADSPLSCNDCSNASQGVTYENEEIISRDLTLTTILREAKNRRNEDFSCLNQEVTNENEEVIFVDLPSPIKSRDKEVRINYAFDDSPLIIDDSSSPEEANKIEDLATSIKLRRAKTRKNYGDVNSPLLESPGIARKPRGKKTDTIIEDEGLANFEFQDTGHTLQNTVKTIFTNVEFSSNDLTLNRVKIGEIDSNKLSFKGIGSEDLLSERANKADSNKFSELEETALKPSDIFDVTNEPIIISETTSDNSKENMNDMESPKRSKKLGKEKPIDTSNSSVEETEEVDSHTPLKDTKNTEAPIDSSFIQTPDLNDTLLSNKINTKLKIKQPVKKKKVKNPKKDRHSKSIDNYCEICDKRFVRSDSLIKHKRTLTHIAKLSEIEAREAAERAKELAPPEKYKNPEENDITKSLLVTSPFSLKTNNDTLKLADIISDVLNKPVIEENMESFSDILEQKETKRYKSLGERKSFDSDSILFNTPKPTFANHINTNLISNKVPNSTGAFLETQISLLENIIENKTNFQYIDEISNKSDERCPSDMSLVSDIKQDDSNIISFSHNTSIVSSIIHSDTNFVKPSQYEEISEDTRNFDEQRARKALNRDEELFLECCSLLKSSSEVSDYSKKSSKTISMVSTYGLKPGEETGWLEHKNMIAKQKSYPNNEEYLSDDNSRADTPIGDNYDDFSNSNTIRTEWNSKLKDGEFEDISLDSLTNSDNNSNFNSFTMNFNEASGTARLGKGAVGEMSTGKPVVDEDDNVEEIEDDDDEFDDLMDDDCLEIIEDDEDDDSDDDDDDVHATNIRAKVNSPVEPTQTSITSYTVPLPKKSDSDSSTNDSKKVMTKGAMKVFEGLKVSIPTEELDMSEVLNCSPTSKRLLLDNIDAIKEDKIEKVVKQNDNLNKFGNKLGLKVTKKRVKPRISQERKQQEGEEGNKVHDIYDFEETQDNTDLFIPNNLKTFRSQLAEKKVEDTVPESDVDSNNQYVDSFSVEAQSVSSFSTETESSLSMKKNPGVKNITKKKCVIMGRIFKNAFKSKSDEIKDLPAIENTKLVENYVMNCPDAEKTLSDERIKMTEQEMDLLFDKLLEENAALGKVKGARNAEKVVPVAKVEGVGRGRPKGSKQKKRVRKQSQSSDDEYNLIKTPKKRAVRKKAKDDGINLEQELKECMGVAGRKSQRKCTSGKQNVLVEDWSSDDSEFEAMIRQTIQQSKKDKPRVAPEVKEPAPVIVEEIKEVVVETKLVEPLSEQSVLISEESKDIENSIVESKLLDEPINTDFLKEIVKDVNEAKPKPRSKSVAKKEKAEKVPKIKPGTLESTLASNRRKRAAADTLYYWSSSSDDDSQNLIEIKSVRDEGDEDDDRPMQHGWIVGDSPKKLVTMLAQAKGKKIDTKCVKEQSKKRTTI